MYLFPRLKKFHSARPDGHVYKAIWRRRWHLAMALQMLALGLAQRGSTQLEGLSRGEWVAITVTAIAATSLGYYAFMRTGYFKRGQRIVTKAIGACLSWVMLPVLAASNFLVVAEMMRQIQS